MSALTLDRRLLTRALAGAGAVALSGCDKIVQNAGVQKVLKLGEPVTRVAQRLILTPGQLAPEYKQSDVSPWFKPNGTTDPQDPAYLAHVKGNFAHWRLEVGGLVEKPMSLSLDDVRARPSRTQITRHDCVEGWSCIGKWTGMRLGDLLKEAKLKPEAKYILFHCADNLGDNGDPSDDYYESIGLADAFHEQTIIAYSLNDKPLMVANGAPLRLRAERNLGYKQAKYVTKIEAIDGFGHLHGGQGGYWEDRGYQWYGGI